MVKAARQKYEEQLAKDSESNPKRLHAHVQSKQSVKNNITSLETANSNIATDTGDICSLLNNYFQSVFVLEPEGPMPDFESRTEANCVIDSAIFSIDIVQKCLDQLDERKSTGYDGLHPRVLSKCSATFSKPLSLIYKCSFATGLVPDLWRKSNVTPIFKKGSKLNASNYRPVSLTSIPCKMMESILQKRIMEHCVINELISPNQHGFVHRKGCVSNLIETRDIMTEATHRSHAVDVIYTDFAKAFDKVPHKRLLHKLRAYGIRGALVEWISAWLSDRCQRVVINGITSEWKAVTSGVPQGLVLGPLLFVIFVNDLPDRITHHMKLYADDSKIIGIIKKESDSITLQEDIDRAVEWSHVWLLHFNVEKCKVMHVGRRYNKSTYNYSMANVDGTRRLLEETTVERDLGVMVSNDLNVRQQIESVASIANRMLGRLKKTFRSRSFHLWRTLYLTYIRPHLEFAVQAWSPHLKSDISILEKVQNRATKTISTIKHLSYEDRLQRLGLTTLEERRKRADLIEQFKITRKLELVSFFVPQKLLKSKEKYILRGHNQKLERQLVKNCPE